MVNRIKYRILIQAMYSVVKIVLITTAVSVSYSYQKLQRNREYVHHNRKLLEDAPGNCTPAAIYDFPSDGFTMHERRQGWIFIHVILAAYCFIVLTIVCDHYFVPGIQTLVKRLEISEHVAGASFMAITSASPELFINCVGTFITEGDIGVGTVVGSNVFNILGAPACCGLFAKMAFQFEKWAILRDGLMYAISVILLIITLHDDEVYWYEALIFVLAYVIYIAIMYYDQVIYNKFQSWSYKPALAKEETKNVSVKETSSDSLLRNNTSLEDQSLQKTIQDTNSHSQNDIKVSIDEQSIDSEDVSIYSKIWNAIIWPIIFATKYTVPNCTVHPRLYPFTLLMCMVWIGFTSYLLAWFITAIGDTINIPDSVMGLSFLAVGSSMPEIVTCVIVSKQGQGVMGMSSALGANTFEILLCLGLPWLIKTLFYPKIPGVHSIHINSSGLAYNASCLLSTLIFLYICLICNRFRLDWKVGVACLIMYGLFLIIGTMIELNVFFPVNPPTCK